MSKPKKLVKTFDGPLTNEAADQLLKENKKSLAK
jgi:hypothetical protein